VDLKRPPRITTNVNEKGEKESNWPDCPHEVLRITSAKCDKSWYIDLTGGQYGIDQTLWLVEDYDKRFVEGEPVPVDDSDEDDFEDDFEDDLEDDFEDDFEDEQTTKDFIEPVIAKAAKYMNKAVAMWVNPNDTRLSDLVKGTESAFRHHTASLLVDIKKAVETVTTEYNEAI